MSAEKAEYLDTETLAGGDGYFTNRTEDDQAHTSPKTALVAASEGDTPPDGDPGADEFSDLTNEQLRSEVEERGLVGGLPDDVTLSRANKTQLLSVLRGE